MALKAFSGGAVFAEVAGTGAPRVLGLHGWGRSSADFRSVLSGMEAVAVDLPGFGSSPPPSAGWGSPDYANAIRDVWSAFDEPPVVVAHSFGGRVAVHLAQDLPMQSLILIGVPLVRPGTASQPAMAFRVARRLHRLGVLSDGRMEAFRQKYGSADYRATSGVMREVFVRVVNETYDEQLDRLAIPVRMLWGANDAAAPLEQAQIAYRRLADRGADVELRVLDGVGHHVMAERPQVVTDLIKELLT